MKIHLAKLTKDFVQNNSLRSPQTLLIPRLISATSKLSGSCTIGSLDWVTQKVSLTSGALKKDMRILWTALSPFHIRCELGNFRYNIYAVN